VPAPLLTPSARLRQLRLDLRQALKSQDADTLRRLSLQVIHRQGPPALQVLMQALADGPQQRFWLDAMQPAEAPQRPLAPAAVEPIAAALVQPSLASEAATQLQSGPEPLQEDLPLASPPEEDLVMPLGGESEAWLEHCETAPVAEPEPQRAVVTAIEPSGTSGEGLLQASSEPEAGLEPGQPAVEPALGHHRVADDAIAPIGHQEELKLADEPAGQRDEQIKQPIAEHRTPLVTPAPLERSRLHQRLKGWLPRWDATHQQAA
jgi:hypothetical protein